MSEETQAESQAAQPVASAPAIMPIDHAEELMAVKAFYESRTVGLRAALRQEQEKNADLTERLEEAEKGVEEVREEIAKLTATKPSEASGKAGKAS